MLERFYPNHVIARLSMTEDEFWDAKVSSCDSEL